MQPDPVIEANEICSLGAGDPIVGVTDASLGDSQLWYSGTHRAPLVTNPGLASKSSLDCWVTWLINAAGTGEWFQLQELIFWLLTPAPLSKGAFENG
ncbi:hypothetical protein EYF80_014582 [Liparis tanakae]|uniref:Uncharacterized protein n=1 Tax=Liparis tanakae TaxID=230148 RepID=A0A4Z2ICK9_9TELE|nr:hypothetical protein EYF80_014582 [Liparis tanakae]